MWKIHFVPGVPRSDLDRLIGEVVLGYQGTVSKALSLEEANLVVASGQAVRSGLVDPSDPLLSFVVFREKGLRTEADWESFPNVLVFESPCSLEPLKDFLIRQT